MAVFTDPRALVRHQKQRVEKVRRSIEATSRDVADFALAEAQKLTSGTAKQATLTAAGHPFARRRGLGGRTGKTGPAATFARFPLLPINQQSGRLRRSWRVFRRRSGKGFVWIVQNLAPHSKFVLSPEGTRLVVPRGLIRELGRRTERYARRHVVKAWRAAHRS